MCSWREDMATTSFDGDSDNEKGFDGSVMLAVGHGAVASGPLPLLLPLWMCRVESHAAEMTRSC